MLSVRCVPELCQVKFAVADASKKGTPYRKVKLQYRPSAIL
jgi:hypothetical protein